MQRSCSAGYESDNFDPFSIHFGAFDQYERMAGAVRLILPSCDKFPIEEKCAYFRFDDLGVPRRECAEISRLTISKIYRRESRIRPAQFLFQVSSIALGLCRQMHQECRALGLNYCLALMEKPLWMLLKIHGFIFWPLGPEIDFYGRVTPYLIDVRDLEKKGVFKGYHGREILVQEDQYA